MKKKPHRRPRRLMKTHEKGDRTSGRREAESGKKKTQFDELQVVDANHFFVSNFLEKTREEDRQFAGCVRCISAAPVCFPLFECWCVLAPRSCLQGAWRRRAAPARSPCLARIRRTRHFPRGRTGGLVISDIPLLSCAPLPLTAR